MSDLYKNSNNPLIDTANKVLTDGKPTSVIGAIALATIAVGGMAIKAIK